MEMTQAEASGKDGTRAKFHQACTVRRRPHVEVERDRDRLPSSLVSSCPRKLSWPCTMSEMTDGSSGKKNW